MYPEVRGSDRFITLIEFLGADQELQNLILAAFNEKLLGSGNYLDPATFGYAFLFQQDFNVVQALTKLQQALSLSGIAQPSYEQLSLVEQPIHAVYPRTPQRTIAQQPLDTEKKVA